MTSKATSGQKTVAKKKVSGIKKAQKKSTDVNEKNTTEPGKVKKHRGSRSDNVF